MQTDESDDAPKQRSTFWLGLWTTVLFYALVLFTPLRDTVVAKYTADHATEYVIIFLFFWWSFDLALLLRRLRVERAALRQQWLSGRSGVESPENAGALMEKLRKADGVYRHTFLARRLRRALAFVGQRGSAEGFDEHLRQLADEDDGAVHSLFAVGRFVIWVTPILGFLGTVIHFGKALRGLTPEQLVEKLPQVTGSMGTAFDTTSAALSIAMFSIFTVFGSERMYHSLLRQIDERTDDLLANRFKLLDARLTPFLDALRVASESTLAVLRESVNEQHRIWTGGVQTLQQQEAELNRQQIDQWSLALRAQSESLAESERNREARILQLLHRLTEERERQDQSLVTTADRVAKLQDQLLRFTDRLTDLVSHQGQLDGLQRQLTENLEVLRQTQRMDEAMQGLTAAIHLMLARHQALPAAPVRPHAA